MKTETIKKVLSIAIENGQDKYFIKNWELMESWYIPCDVCLEKVITSKEFIDAYAKYLWDKREIFWNRFRFQRGNFLIIFDDIEHLKRHIIYWIWEAIYNSTLEEFFSNLIK